MKELVSLTLEELTIELEQLGEKKFRAKQVFQWIHEKNALSFDEMTNLSTALREKLKGNYRLTNMKVLEKLTSKDKTIKYLLELQDGHVIECVLMHYKHGYSICISSQVGCRMGCSFCASTIGGLERNLTAGEMLGQVYLVQRDQHVKVKNLVVMGSGEPLENYEELVQFLHLIRDEKGQNMSHRHITVSTCGLVNRIKDLAKENLQITLAISLHAPFDELRKKLMPINNKYDIEQLMKACKEYTDKTHRRITYEYALIRGTNDTDACVNELGRLLKGQLAHINLIPINDVKERDYIKSTERRIEQFAASLEKKGINVTVRRELGSDINAACGQLRKSHMDQKSK